MNHASEKCFFMSSVFFRDSSNDSQKQPPDVFYQKTVLKNFIIFTGNHLCWSLNEVVGTILKNFCERLFLGSVHSALTLISLQQIQLATTKRSSSCYKTVIYLLGCPQMFHPICENIKTSSRKYQGWCFTNSVR